MKNDVLSNPIYVFGHHRVVDHLRLLLDFRRELPSKSDLFCLRTAEPSEE
jgi:hypothetical protein